jgi:maleate isomerase
MRPFTTLATAAMVTSQATKACACANKTFINGVVKPDKALIIRGAISGKSFVRPDTTSGYPLVSPIFFDRVTKTKSSAPNTQAVITPYPDFGSSALKLGLFVPSTNTAMEQELWTILKKGSRANVQGSTALNGVGIHTVNVVTPKPQVGTKAEVEQYKSAFLGGLQSSLRTVLMAEPQYLIMGMSMEHIIDNMEEMQEPMQQIVDNIPGGAMGMSTWHLAIKGALDTMFPNNGKPLRVGLLTPFDESGNENAIKMFENEEFFGRGMQVTRSYIFQCATTLDIAHVSDSAKEMAVHMLAYGHPPDSNQDQQQRGVNEAAGVDVIVQCGTNFDMNRVAEKMEPIVGVPVLGINTVLLWHSLRENGIDAKIDGASRIFREH